MADETLPPPSGLRRFFRPGLFRMILNLIVGLICVKAGVSGVLSGIFDLAHSSSSYFTSDLLFSVLLASWVVPGTMMVLASLYFFGALRKKRKDRWLRSVRFLKYALVAQCLPVGATVLNVKYAEAHPSGCGGLEMIGILFFGVIFFLIILSTFMTFRIVRGEPVRAQFPDLGLTKNDP